MRAAWRYADSFGRRSPQSIATRRNAPTGAGRAATEGGTRGEGAPGLRVGGLAPPTSRAEEVTPLDGPQSKRPSNAARTPQAAGNQTANGASERRVATRTANGSPQGNSQAATTLRAANRATGAAAPDARSLRSRAARERQSYGSERAPRRLPEWRLVCPKGDGECQALDRQPAERRRRAPLRWVWVASRFRAAQWGAGAGGRRPVPKRSKPQARGRSREARARAAPDCCEVGGRRLRPLRPETFAMAATEVATSISERAGGGLIQTF